MLIREMTEADCEAVAAVRTAGWRTAYAGLLPPAYLASLDPAENASRHRARLAGSDGTVVDLLAERGGTVVGWACFGPYRPAGTPGAGGNAASTADAELYALYVDPEHWSTGAGRALMDAVLGRCRAAGRPRVLLWVLEGNARARRFYERSGFGPDGAREPFAAGGVTVPEVRYVRVSGRHPGQGGRGRRREAG
ncbi:GNAT family N-acetyltransferase, partial [Streptomyces sp. GC420]|uniref:GNAT family N-acetyltransferase n=1 Tax=Streptomyces sp. GC420 TaxID=2697568 RepID=UPI0014150421